MGKFKLTDNETGKTVVVSGDSAPTEAEAEQIFNDAGLRSQPSAPQQAAKPTDVGPIADSINTLPGAVKRGFSAVAGLPGDVMDLGQSAADFGARMMGKEKAAPIRNVMGIPGPMNPLGTLMTLPTGKQIADTVAPEGGYYKPQTDFGKLVDTVGTFTPIALMPGTILARIARTVVPGATSEAAGRMAEGTKWEPIARAGGALVGGLATGGLEAAIANRKIPPTPSLEQLGNLKTEAYKAADDAGVIIAPDAFQKFATDLGADITRNNVVQKDLHKNTMAALSILQDEASAGVPLTLKRADEIRKAVGGAIESAAGMNGNSRDLALAMKVQDGLDDFLDALPDNPGAMLAGDPAVAVPILKQARSLARREFKGEEIHKLIDVAKNRASTNYSAAGEEQAIRAQFMQLNDKLIKNKNLAKTFTPEERAAIVKVVKGGPLGNALRRLGKYSPTGPVSSGSAAMLGGGGGAAIGTILGGGPVGAALGGMLGAGAVGGTGALARMGATSITNKNAQAVSELVRGGVPAATKPVARDLLINALLTQQAAR